MELREALASDIPAIVELLKVSLGEGLMPKSSAYWHWKHMDNPFGRSPVLLAFDGNHLVGVRAFMRWGWENGDERIRALRAVDTATHPAYQGKGIFSKLTKALLLASERDGASLVFNTPNEKSLPGYLKMGWSVAGRLPLRISVRRPVSIARNIVAGNALDDRHAKDGSVEYFLGAQGCAELLEANKILRSGNYISGHTVASLKWRYNDVPVAHYYADGIESHGLRALYFFRLKRSRPGLEMRITDCLLENRSQLKPLRHLIKKKARSLGVDYISCEGMSDLDVVGGIRIARRIGPVVTVRKVADNHYQQFLDFSRWRPSLGDMELF